jgi:capsular exopolysaccharide synthesis family protein
MDLRKPKISKLLSLQNDIGISNYLVNQCTLNEIIKETDIKDLYVVSSGIIPPNPMELIQRSKFGEMMAELKARFDYVIIDTAPVGPVSDAFLLKQYVDATIYIVRHNGTFKTHLKMIEDLKKQKKFNNLCIVFNGVRKRGFTYGSYSYGNYGSNYGGYYVNDEQRGGVKRFGRKLKKTLGI